MLPYRGAACKKSANCCSSTESAFRFGMSGTPASRLMCSSMAACVMNKLKRYGKY